MKQFKPFWFEGNAWFKMVNSQEELDQLYLVYLNLGYTKEQVLSAKECEYELGDIIKFGFARECSGERTLKEFLE